MMDLRNERLAYTQQNSKEGSDSIGGVREGSNDMTQDRQPAANANVRSSHLIQLTASPRAWKKNSLDTPPLQRISLLKLTRRLSISVTMNTNNA
jgi:hypothetical protein